MKKKLIAILLITVSIFTVTFTQLPALANQELSVDIEQFEQYTAELNAELDANNTTVEEQLNNLDQTYSNILNDTHSKTVNTKINNLKNFNRDILNYDLCTYSSANQNLINIVLKGVNSLSRIAILKCISAGLAVFHLMNWDLTIELLVNGFLLDSSIQPHDGYVYNPTYGYIVKQTQLFKDIANGNKIASESDDSFVFPINPISRGITTDLGLAIHEFSFIKPHPTSKTVIIKDTYDYSRKDNDKEFKGIFKPVINALCDLHDLGLFTYYDIEITETLDLTAISSGEDKGYHEQKLDLHEKELKDFEISFSTDGNRIIQVLGSGLAALYILNEKGQVQSYDYGSGYDGNSLISFNFKKNKKYILRVANKAKNNNLNAKLTIYNDSREISNFEQLNLQEISTGTYSGSAAPNNLYMVKFAPQETKKYEIKITTENKYYAYLICLTDATISSGSTSFRGPIILENNLGNYVGGGTTKNLISMTLYNDCEYLLIICGNPAKTETVAFSYNLS